MALRPASSLLRDIRSQAGARIVQRTLTARAYDVCYTEPNGSLFSHRRPRLHSPRRPDSPGRARTARLGQRDDHRARRALRHVSDGDEEAHPAARGGRARHDGEGRPRPQVHARAVRIRGHHHVGTKAGPIRPGSRTHERSLMSPTKKQEGFSAEEKAAMRARAKELKAAAEGEEAIAAALKKMAP